MCYYCTGKCIRKVMDLNEEENSIVYSLCLSDKTLIVPSCHDKLLYYGLETIESDQQGCD